MTVVVGWATLMTATVKAVVAAEAFSEARGLPTATRLELGYRRRRRDAGLPTGDGCWWPTVP